MRKLFHWPLDPAGRFVRLALAEKQIEHQEIESPPWKPVPEVLTLTAGPRTGPVLLDQGGVGRVVAVQTHAITEYLEETYTQVKLLPPLANDRAEARRLWRWVESRFNDEINGTILAERIAIAVQRKSVPDSASLVSGAHALRGLLTYLNALAGERVWLAGRQISLADFSLAAHLSALDYFGDVSWDDVVDLRDWYARMKSRPSFRGVLSDRLSGTRPSKHYADLDF